MGPRGTHGYSVVLGGMRGLSGYSRALIVPVLCGATWVVRYSAQHIATIPAYPFADRFMQLVRRVFPQARALIPELCILIVELHALIAELRTLIAELQPLLTNFVPLLPKLHSLCPCCRVAEGAWLSRTLADCMQRQRQPAAVAVWCALWRACSFARVCERVRARVCARARMHVRSCACAGGL